MPTDRFQAYGLSVVSSFPLPGHANGVGDRRPNVRVTRAQARDASFEAVEGDPVWSTVMGDGVELQYRLRADGERRILYGDTLFCIDSELSNVRCLTLRPDDPGWQRQLLDTVLFIVSFERGFELLHAGAVVTPRGAVAFLGASGQGKSTLLAELIARGNLLLSDDVVALQSVDGSILAYPGPAVMNLPHSWGAPELLRQASIIAAFASERESWIAVAGAATAPVPLACLYVLSQQSGASDVQALEGATFVDVAPHCVSLPHPPQRARRRFQLLSEIATRVPLRHLKRGRDGTPARLAELVETDGRDDPSA